MWAKRYSTSRRPYFTYLISRLWRLLPIFLLADLLTLAVDRLIKAPITQATSIFDKLHFAVAHTLILGYTSLYVLPLVPAWSLDLEMQFYLVLPLLVWLVMRIRNPFLLLLTAGSISLASAFCFGKEALSSHLIYFAAGITAASFKWRPAPKLVMAATSLDVLFIAVCLLCPAFGLPLMEPSLGPWQLSGPQSNNVIALLAIPYALFSTGQPGGSSDRALGDLSYVVYLLHWPGIILCTAYGGAGLHRRIYMWAVWLAVYAFSMMIWKIYDLPLNNLRARWVRRRTRSPETRSLETSSLEIGIA